jgi:DNA repair protein RadC
MNFAMFDRIQLESIILEPPAVEAEPLRCSEDLVVELLPPAADARATRLRHVLAAAHELLVRIASETMTGRSVLGSPTLVKDFLKILLAGAEREAFVVIFLDAQMRVIGTEEVFSGTLTQTAVYPREIVRLALHHNAASVICAHPHPSGEAEPSRADESLTHSLKAALDLIDVRLVDHIVVAGSACTSFAERGLL